MRGVLLRYAAAAALTAGMMFAQQQGPFTTQPAPTTQQVPQRITERLNDVARVLELSPDQQTQMQNIIQNAFNQARPIVQSIRQNRQQLRQQLESGTQVQVQNYAQAQGNLAGQLAAIRANALQQFLGILNPQQRQRAVALYDLMHHHEGMHE